MLILVLLCFLRGAAGSRRVMVRIRQIMDRERRMVEIRLWDSRKPGSISYGDWKCVGIFRTICI